MKETVLAEIKILLEQQPLLTQHEVTDGININGNYKICNQIEDEVFEDYFALEIFIPDSFPDDIPTAKTTDGRIRASNYKGHVYPNNQFCLEIDTAMIACLQDNPSLLAFLTKYLDTYLCGFLFYQKHKRLPFGEHKHGVAGLLDYYCELFEVAGIKIAYSLLYCLFDNSIKGHVPCPCQSGNRYRNCHRERVNALKLSSLYERYRLDFATIYTELSEQNKE